MKPVLFVQAKITPDEDTRPECRNVGSWIVTSLGYVHKIFTNQSSILLCLMNDIQYIVLYLQDDMIKYI